MTTPVHAGWCPSVREMVHRELWPFYLDRRQRALLRGLRDAWGEDAVIQIYDGCVRIRSEHGDQRFYSEAALRPMMIHRSDGASA
ncbi:hypothetical protein P3T23_009615 [Paraburkholderia sp. GAS448]|uniref:hypothetical protein n=1 Tax=Paraburkholderia sp. GAS448 TaxID=3035136 RepID=UPI003D237463